jgi:hypothetical protein
VPTERISALSTKLSIELLMMLTISSDLIAIVFSVPGPGALCRLTGGRRPAAPGHELRSQPLEATAHRCIEKSIAHLDGEAADE